MPKITTQKVYRIHISLPESDYLRALKFAKQNNTSISQVLRICLGLLDEPEPTPFAGRLDNPSSKQINF